MSQNTGTAAAAWWRDLRPDQSRSDPRRRVGDRAALARLRRCATVLEAAAEPATHRLLRDLGGDERRLDRAALIAAVLAHVREEATEKVARQIGPSRERPTAMSDLRFRRLMQADTDDEQLVSFRRLVALADRKLNVADLAGSLWHWSERRRLAWMYAYHDAPDPPGSPAPEDASA